MQSIQELPEEDFSYIPEEIEDGFEGDAGETGTLDVSEVVCAGITCSGHGICADKDGKPFCECDDGYTGVYCESFTSSKIVIYPLDQWGRKLDEKTTLFEVKYNGMPQQTSLPFFSMELPVKGKISVQLVSENYYPFSFEINYSGANSKDSYSIIPYSDENGNTVSHARKEAGGKWVHYFFIGLRHKWFSSVGAPFRKGNYAELLLDGEETWKLAYYIMNTAEKEILLSTWWWSSYFELIRGSTIYDIYQTEQEKWQNTIMAVLEGMPAVNKKVIVNQFLSQDGMLESFNIDDLLSDKGAAKNDNFEFMGQVNPTTENFYFKIEPFIFSDRIKQNWPELSDLAFVDEKPVESPVPGHYVDISLPLGMEEVISAASYHQKFIIVDGTAAFVSGMNLRTVDWDTSEHLVYDPRRMYFSSTIAKKEDVLAKVSLPDNGPRKDMTIYIEGPVVEDISAVFKKRWDYLLGQGVKYSENSTSLTVKKDLPGFPDGVEAQVTVTMPEPFNVHGILETWYGAIKNAKKYIYIESQYFKAPMLNDLIVKRMKEEPGLVLIVVTKPISEWLDPSCWWTYKTDKLFKEEFPDRYFVYQLRSFDFVDVGWGIDETESRFLDIDTHTKCLIVDDLFISVGSANYNNRGLIYEGEMNVAVLDDWFVREARRSIFRNILKDFYSDSDTVSDITDDFKKAAAWNQFVWENWEAEGWDIDLNGASLPIEYSPIGFLYPLDLGNPDDCLFEDISPDLMNPLI